MIRDVNLARIGADYHAIRTIKARCARAWCGQIGCWHGCALADQVKGDRGLGWIVGRQGKLSSAHTNSCWEATDRDRGGCTSFCNRGRQAANHAKVGRVVAVDRLLANLQRGITALFELETFAGN